MKNEHIKVNVKVKQICKDTMITHHIKELNVLTDFLSDLNLVFGTNFYLDETVESILNGDKVEIELSKSKLVIELED